MKYSNKVLSISLIGLLACAVLVSLFLRDSPRDGATSTGTEEPRTAASTGPSVKEDTAVEAHADLDIELAVGAAGEGDLPKHAE